MIDVHINRLRNKIDRGSTPLIHTVRGHGYVCEPPKETGLIDAGGTAAAGCFRWRSAFLDPCFSVASASSASKTLRFRLMVWNAWLVLAAARLHFSVCARVWANARGGHGQSVTAEGSRSRA